MSRMPRRDFLSIAVPACFLLPPRAEAQEKNPRGSGDEAIVEVLTKVRKSPDLPGIIGAIASPDQPTRVGAVGLRKSGAPEPFGADDLVHLGSDTKAMTATMIATLVEEGKLSWSSTLGEVLPDPATRADFRPVTLEQLLTHRAGLKANGPWNSLGPRPATDQRRQLLRKMTSLEPESKPGTAFLYSNVGYALAGLMAEAVTGQSWEDLMRKRLFEPLGMKTAGFGPPGTPGKADQPWGHLRQGAALKPLQFDNPEALGPAGTVHASMADWGKFANLHLQGARGEKTPILKPETFKALQTPRKGEEYAKGWIVTERPWAGGKVLTHAGSNTLWYATIWLAPKKNFAFMAAANLAGDLGPRATDEAVAGMIGLAG